MDWLSKTDPDVLIGFLTLLSSVGAWLYHKARGQKTDSFQTTMEGVLRNFVVELLDQYDGEDLTEYLKAARIYIEKRAWSVLAKRGIPKNALTENLLHQVIEHATADLGNLIAKAMIPKALEDLAKKAALVSSAFNPPQSNPITPAPTP